MSRTDLTAAKTAYEAAYAESLRQYQQDRDHAAFSARNAAAARQYKAVERQYWDAVDADLTAQARQDHRHDEF